MIHQKLKILLFNDNIYTGVCKLRNENNLKKFFYSKRIAILHCHIRNTPFWSYTALEMFLPQLITVIELRYWNSLQLVSYSYSNVFDCVKMSSFEVIFQLRKEKKVTRTQGRWIRRLRSHRNVFTGQKLVIENAV